MSAILGKEEEDEDREMGDMKMEKTSTLFDN